MTRRTGLLIGTAFLAGIAAGPTAGWMLRHTAASGFGAARADDSSKTTDTFHLLTLFGDVFETVRADYVQPVDDKTVIENALEGMVGGLDPHSAYMDAKSYADMQV